MDDTMGQRLKKMRLERKLSQQQVATLIGVSRNTISAYETDLREPTYSKLIRLARIYRVSVETILGISEEEILHLNGLSKKERDLLKDIVDIFQGNKRK
ncbi:MAG: helix-turn-helix transcriptional regulator [Parasporobacterium sp.]|nr:helix-turn-helix transcriptional regulator [Parasporobacterium sp.]